MGGITAGEITALLQEWRSGDDAAIGRVTAMIYQDLQRMAAQHLKGEWSSQTLEACALIHEVYVRVQSLQDVDWTARSQFISTAAALMRNILVDHARRRKALKRKSPFVRPKVDVFAGEAAVDVIAIHIALDKLAVEFPRSARAVELRFFGGLAAEETAEVLGISLSTVEREWRFARAWLRNEIG